MNRKALPVLALMILLIGVITGLAEAQTHHKVSVEASVPFEFVVGNRFFPAGTYVFEMATGSPRTTDQMGVLIVHSRDTAQYAAVATDIAADTNAHLAPKLVFTRRGERVFLSKVWRQGNPAGLSLHAHSTQTAGWQQSEVVTLEAFASNGGI